MQIRKLNAQEAALLRKAQSIAFVFPIDIETIEEEPPEHCWGAFDDSGNLVSGMANWPLPMYYDGHVVGMGGIGGVISLPEARMRGNIRGILRAVFADICEAGGVFSMLYPFSQTYYRQFGYEVCYAAHTYTFPTEQLKAYRQTGTARMVMPGDCDAVFRSIYDTYARRYNCAVARDDFAWKRVLRDGDPYKCESYRYVLEDDGQGTAYCMFKPIKTGEYSFDLLLTDFAYTGPKALHSLLGFLYKLAPQYHNIRIQAPSDLHPALFLPEPGTLRIAGMTHIMARVLDARRALSLMRHPAGEGAYRITILDDFLPDNTGTYSVRFGAFGVDVQKGEVDAPSDLRVSVQAFAQLCLGFCALPAALLRADVELVGNQAVLEKVFVEKPRFHSDRY